MTAFQNHFCTEFSMYHPLTFQIIMIIRGILFMEIASKSLGVSKNSSKLFNLISMAFLVQVLLGLPTI